MLALWHKASAKPACWRAHVFLPPQDEKRFYGHSPAASGAVHDFIFPVSLITGAALALVVLAVNTELSLLVIAHDGVNIRLAQHSALFHSPPA